MLPCWLLLSKQVQNWVPTIIQKKERKKEIGCTGKQYHES